MMQPLRLCRNFCGFASRSGPTTTSRFLSSTSSRSADRRDRAFFNAEGHHEAQTSRHGYPHLTNTTSTVAHKMPSVGAYITPTVSVPENTERMTGETQKNGPEDGANADLAVGEIEGAEFKVVPLRREGEDPATMRARLLCPCDAQAPTDRWSSYMQIPR